MTDGTPKGTRKLIGGPGGECNAVYSAGDRAFIAYAGPTGGNEPWVTDGTVEGTVSLGDLDPGDGSSYPSDFTPCGTKTCFAASANGRGLFVTDGTAAGTHRLDLSAVGNPGPSRLVQSGALAFFVGYLASTGSELWVTDGTVEGTRFVKDIHPGSESGAPGELVALGDRILFRAEDGAAGQELWTSDGTSEGTVMVKDLYPGARAGYPEYLTRLGTRILFVGGDPDHGYQLWTTDGTEGGTAMVKVIRANGITTAGFAVRGERAFFKADDGEHGYELWVTDGTAAGTRMVVDAIPGADGVDPYPLEVLHEWERAAIVGPPDELLFAGWDADRGYELWRSDGTAAGTEMVVDLYPGEAWAIPMN